MEIRDIARAMQQAAAQLRQRPTSQEAYEGIVRHATQALPGFEHVTLSTVRAGTVTVLHASTELASGLDALQHELDEGPSVDALHHDVTVVAAPVRHDQRWPGYVRHAVRRGVCAQVALRVFVDEVGTVGALNMYSTTAEVLTDDQLVVAEMYAAHAAVVLGKVRQAAELTGAMDTRQSIGVAIGLLMEQYRLDEVRAKAFLWRTSSTSNVKVRDVAAAIIERANREFGDTPR